MLTSEKKQGQPHLDLKRMEPLNKENAVQGALTYVAKDDGVGAFFLFSFPSFFLLFFFSFLFLS